jgi:fucokinase
LDAWEGYKQAITRPNSKQWDYVVLTAANELQAQGYREQIEYRLSKGMLPKSVQFLVIPDPQDKRVGSGGATLNVLCFLRDEIGCNSFSGKHILCIHSGGDSKRIPQYSACGKLFSPVPRRLPDGRRSTLFDEFIIWMTSVPPRITDGLLVCSGDVLLLFNPLQIDFYGTGAAAISFKQTPEVGQHHGVYVSDENGIVNNFLHKQEIRILNEKGALDKRGKVDIDTGAVILCSKILDELYTLVDTKEKHQKYINENVRLSFYADFLYPLANDSTLELYLQEKPEGDFSDELMECRKMLWDVLSKYQLRLIRLAPASFVHFGTTKELLELMTSGVSDYKWLDWSKHVLTNTSDDSYSASNSFIESTVDIGEGCYIEDSIICGNTVIGKGCVISCCDLHDVQVSDGTVLHTLKLKDGRFCVRKYGVADNPKDPQWFGKSLNEPLWEAPVHPVRKLSRDAVAAALRDDIKEPRMSLQESFVKADTAAIGRWQTLLHDTVQSDRILTLVKNRVSSSEALEEFLQQGVSKGIIKRLFEAASDAGFSDKIRIYYYTSLLTSGTEREEALNKCFSSIRDSIFDAVLEEVRFDETLRIKKDPVTVNLPLRVNFGGGWSDTPPYCLEHGGDVLNAAITVNDEFPVEAVFNRIDDNIIILRSIDDDSEKSFYDIKELQSCNDPYDTFALHKAALITCGVIPLSAEAGVNLGDILQRIGGGFELITQVCGIPRGSGLGTSSILAGACVKAAFEFFGKETTEVALYNRVLCMEQLMSTGGGWQDQVGGLVPGIKMISSEAAIKQQIKSTPLNISEETYRQLDERFCLIYTGQRRLARNLLRDIVGNYLKGCSDTLYVLDEIKRVAHRMKDALEAGDVDLFAKILDEHWELSKKLDAGSTNSCIDQMLLAIDDLLDGRMICGAGGGGVLQVILKAGVTREMLSHRLGEIFYDCGVDVWKCRITREDVF